MTAVETSEGNLLHSVDSQFPVEAKKKLIATHAKLEISLTLSKHRASRFLIGTKNTFPFRFLLVHHKPQAGGHEPRFPGSDDEPGSWCAVSARYRDTIRGRYDTFLRGAKQNWRNSNHA